jgi:hypothetical protein
MNEPPKDTMGEKPEWKAAELQGPALRIGRSGSKIFIEAGQPRLVVNATQAREIAAQLVLRATEVETR